jgi:pyruvyltransferase
MKNDLPLVSFCLFTYNQEDYIAEAIDGALQQDYQNLEIIISDDCSTDATWAIIQEKCARYNGKHKLNLNRNDTNLGLAAHTNKLYYELSHGKYVAIGAGDDISLPSRISKSLEFLERNHDVVALSTGLEVIDAQTQLHPKQRNVQVKDQIFDLNYYLSKDYQHVNGPSRIIRRNLVEAFPPLNSNCPTEDTTMLLRSFMFGKVALLKEKLVKYRLHDSNISSTEGLKKMNLENIFEQNFGDVSYAINKYINEQEYQKITRKLESLKNRRLKKQVYRSKKPLSKRVINKVFRKIIKPKLLNAWFNEDRSAINLLTQFVNSKKQENKTIKLGGSTWSKNYGDALNRFLIQDLVGSNYYESHFYNDEKEEFLMIGSILHRLKPNSVVWGAGLIKEGIRLEYKPKKVYAVRGPLTRKELIKNKIDCPEVYGDPALLLPFYYKPKKNKKKYKYGLLPHYMDKYHPFILQFSKRDDVIFIDIEKDYDNWTDLIDIMFSCENVLTSSLHGVILSDSYEIPNLWFKATDGVTGNGFKFRDYYQSVNKTITEPLDLNSDSSISSINQRLSGWKAIDFDYKKLIDSFPYQELLIKSKF